MLYDAKDENTQRYFLRRKQPPKVALGFVVDWIARHPAGARLDAALLGEAVAERWVEVITSDLCQLGLLARASMAEPPRRLDDFHPEATLQKLSRIYQERRARQQARLMRVVAYARAAGCRTRDLMEYLAEQLAAGCARCDGCAVGGARLLG